MNSIIDDSNIITKNEISNICTLYVNTLTDGKQPGDTESDCHVEINVNWEKNKLNKISCTSLSVPISNYLITKNVIVRVTVSSTLGAITTKDLTFNPSMVDNLPALVKELNTQLGGQFSANNIFKYDYDPNYLDPTTQTNDPNVNSRINQYGSTGRIYSTGSFTFKFENMDGVDIIAPILGLKKTLNEQKSVKIGDNYAMPYIADIIPYSIIYLACDECNNGILSSNGSSILASIFYNNEKNFTYMRQDFSLVANSKWITQKANSLHLYFLDENKKKIENFNGIGAFITLNLYHDSSDVTL